MKWIIRIALILSLALNGYFIFDEIMNYRIQEFQKALNQGSGLKSTKTNWQHGLELLTLKLKEKDKTLAKKKYFYVNVWIDWCKPCIREMPWLDSLAGNLNKDVAYLFVSEMDDSTANNCLKKKNYRFKNFVSVNNMNDFVSAISTDNIMKSKAYPMILILNAKGEVLYSTNGAYSNRRDAAGFTDLINSLE